MAGYMYLGNKKVCPAILIGGDEKVFNVDGYQWFGEIDDNGVLSVPKQDIELVFDGVKNISTNFINSLMTTNSRSRIKSVAFPDLEQITGDNALYAAFRNNPSKIVSILFQKLRVASGTDAFINTFWYNKIPVISFPALEETGMLCFEGTFGYGSVTTEAHFDKLKKFGEYSFASCFFRNTALRDVYFNSVKADSFDDANGALEGMLEDCSNVTLHFPSNVQAVIQELSDYPNFSGTNTTILYDLEPTE